jgi:YHS domain-containing protein
MTNLDTTITAVKSTVIDPVCGMSVVHGEKNLVTVYNGKSYWFCAMACRETFEENPQKYLEPKCSKRKGWFGRYLERLARTNEREFGGGALKCH